MFADVVSTTNIIQLPFKSRLLCRNKIQSPLTQMCILHYAVYFDVSAFTVGHLEVNETQ